MTALSDGLKSLLHSLHLPHSLHVPPERSPIAKRFTRSSTLPNASARAIHYDSALVVVFKLG